MSQQNEVFLNVAQVAERLGVSSDSIYRWKREGDFPMGIQLSRGTVRWRLSDVVAWENTRRACFAMHL